MKNKYYDKNKTSANYYSTKNVISRHITGKNKNILDVGCNEGYFGFNNIEKSNNYYGIDIMDESLEVASKKYTAVEIYNLEQLKDLNFKVKFDYIIYGDVLEHIKNPEEVIKFFTKNFRHRRYRSSLIRR